MPGLHAFGNEEQPLEAFIGVAGSGSRHDVSDLGAGADR
jgi:hypothetical protein